MTVNELIAMLQEFPPEQRTLQAVISSEWGLEEVANARLREERGVKVVEIEY